MSRPTAKPKTEAVPVPRGTPAKNEYKFEYIPMLSDLCVQAIANNFQCTSLSLRPTASGPLASGTARARLLGPTMTHASHTDAAFRQT